MAVGDLITLDRYNQLQTLVSSVLGNGSGRFGYGQSVKSSLISSGKTITAEDMQNLRFDINRASRHQTDLDSGITFPRVKIQISNITKETPVVVTTLSPHNLKNDQIVSNFRNILGVPQLENRQFTVQIISPTAFSLFYKDQNFVSVPLDGSTIGVYLSGGEFEANIIVEELYESYEAAGSNIALNKDLANPNQMTAEFARLTSTRTEPWGRLVQKSVCDPFTVNRSAGVGIKEFTINLGTYTGTAGINFDAFNNPDKFTIIWDGQEYTSGIRGSTAYNTQLSNIGQPPVSGGPSGTLTFNKTKSTPTTAIVRVEGYFPGTEREFRVICPPNPPTNEAGDPSVVHEFRVVFNNADHRRHFFNSGGEIRIESTLTDPVGAKSIIWNKSLLDAGTVRFNSEKAVGSTGTTENVGNFQLNDKFRTLYSKIVDTSNVYGIYNIYTGPLYAGAYNENLYVVKARGEQNSNIITFRIEFYDNSAEYADNLVKGVLRTRISQYRATGQFVEVESPTYQTTKDLGEGAVVPPVINACDPKQGVNRVGRGTYTYTINFGNFVGTCGINYFGYDTVPDIFTITWNGKNYTTGLVKGRGQLLFNKTSATPSTATLTVDASRRGTLFDWSVICPQTPP
jgi:hypothetical protein